MKMQLSGTRNGEPWPTPGQELDLPDDEAAQYCANGFALPVRSDGDDVEKRADAEPKPKAKPKATAASGEKR